MTENDLRNLILKHNRRLQKLKEQKAIKGISTDPQVLIEIEDIEGELQKLQFQLTQQEEIRSSGKKITNISSDQFHKLQLSSFRAVAKEAIGAKQNYAAEARSFNFGEFRGEEEIGPSNVGTMGLVNYFQNGLVVWHDFGKHARQAFAVYGGIGYRYKKMKDRWKILGFPISDEKEATVPPLFGTTGRYNLFEDGVIVWYSGGRFRDTSYAIWGPIANKYLALKGTDSYLGFPVGEPYLIEGGERCDFEGGAIVYLNDEENAEIVRQLLRIDYADSPFEHEWKQYAGPTDPECISVRLETVIGRSKNYIAFNFPWDDRAVKYPDTGYASDTLRERYCGVTVKSLSPEKWIRFYLKVETNSSRHQYLEFDSGNREKKLTIDENENVEYWNVPLPGGSNDGEWHTFIIDLNKHVLEGLKNPYKWLRSFHFRGNIGISDLILSDSREAIEKISINPVRL